MISIVFSSVNSWPKKTSDVTFLHGLIAMTFERLFMSLRFVVHVWLCSCLFWLQYRILIWPRDHQELDDIEWVRCNERMKFDFHETEDIPYNHNVQSSVPYHRLLTTRNCRALVYRYYPLLVMPLNFSLTNPISILYLHLLSWN